MGGNTVIFKACDPRGGERPDDGGGAAAGGAPAGVLNTVTGLGSVIGDYVVSHKDVDFINFTGSTEVGKHISSLTSMTPVIMELGGKDAAIVLEDADLDFAADNIVDGAYSYSGQRCTAVKRILVAGERRGQLIERENPDRAAESRGPQGSGRNGDAAGEQEICGLCGEPDAYGGGKGRSYCHRWGKGRKSPASHPAGPRDHGYGYRMG